MTDQKDWDADDQLPSLSPHTVIGGKYCLEQLIGRGGMGSVWAAVHLGLGQRVAVKLIARRYASAPDARQRFDREAKAAAQLRSRFAVQVYDNGEMENGTPYMVMELLEGESLGQRIQRVGPIHVEDSRRILSQVARALSRAHALSIIHRDLKPENIFLTYSLDDRAEIAKVLDFGIAKIAARDRSASATISGAVLGTPQFMSPEQARGLRSINHRTDIYSFGMVAYAMMAGRPAFIGESFGDVLVAICTRELPSLHAEAPWLPPAIDRWLSRACAREPAERYDSIDETVAALDAVFADAYSKYETAFLPSGVPFEATAPSSLPPPSEAVDAHRSAAVLPSAPLRAAASLTPLATTPGRPIRLRPGPLSRGMLVTIFAAAGLAAGVAFIASRYIRNPDRSASLPMAALQTVTLESDPSGAIVSWNGQSMGRTPVTFQLPRGTQTLVVSKEGYLAAPAVIDLNAPSGVVSQSITLRSVPDINPVNSAPPPTSQRLIAPTPAPVIHHATHREATHSPVLAEVHPSAPTELPPRSELGPALQTRVEPSVAEPSAAIPSPQPPDVRPVAPSSTSAIVPGTIDPSAVADTISAHQAEIQACIDRARMDHTDVHGRLTIQAIIGASGNVLSTTATSTIEGGARLRSCLVSAFQSWIFPAPAGGVNGKVSRTFVFE